MSESGGSGLQYIDRVHLAPVTKEARQAMPIRRANLRRLFRDVQGLGKWPAGTVGSTMAATFIGAAVGMAGSILPVMAATSDAVDSWLIPVMVSVVAGLVALACVAFFFHRRERRRHKNEVEKLCDFMKDMAKEYDWVISDEGEIRVPLAISSEPTPDTSEGPLEQA